MLKLITLFLIYILVFPAIWANTLKPTIDPADGKATVYAGRAGVYYEMVTDSGTGTSSGSDLEAYIPMDSGGSGSYSILDDSGATLPDDSTATSYIRLYMTVANTTSDTLYVHAAVKNEGTYEWFRIANPGFTSSYAGPTTTVENQLIYISTTNLCGVSAVSCTDGSKQEVYVFLDTRDYDDFSDGDEISTSSVPDGAYFSFLLSAAQSGVQSKTVTITDVEIGDKRVKLTYDGQTLGDDFHQIAVINYPSAQGSLTYLNATAGGVDGVLLERMDSTQADGDISINDLSNGRTYNLALGFIDRFQFVTALSASVAATPEEIEAFLEKQACYLLSAGFQKEHYVLDYFRNFRDTILLKTALGSRFVEWYYKTAPQYARIIYKSTFLSACIRGLGYLSYFIMNNFVLVIAGGFLSLGLLCIYRFRKI